MKNKEEIQKILRSSLPRLKEDFKISSLEIFGSYLRNRHNKDSDLDILVEYKQIPDLFEFMALENYLTDLLKIKVDLVMKDSLKTSLKKKIIEEAVTI